MEGAIFSFDKSQLIWKSLHTVGEETVKHNFENQCDVIYKKYKSKLIKNILYIEIQVMNILKRILLCITADSKIIKCRTNNSTSFQ